MSYILRRKGYGEGLVDVALFSKTGLTLETAETQSKEAEYCFRWGCTANVYAKHIVNSAPAIHLVYNKVGFRRILNENNLCPKTWTSLHEYFSLEFADGIDQYPFPVLVRPNNHSRSEGMNVCKDIKELSKIAEQLGNGNYYISEIIQKTHEYRVMFVQGRVIGVIEKFPRDKKALSWGCVDNGDFTYINWEDWPLDMIEVAMKAADLSGLDFGAIDVISDKDRHYVLEINSACWLSPYFCKIFVEAFDYIVKNGHKKFSRYPEKGYRGYIHPSRPANGVVL